MKVLSTVVLVPTTIAIHKSNDHISPDARIMEVLANIYAKDSWKGICRRACMDWFHTTKNLFTLPMFS